MERTPRRRKLARVLGLSLLAVSITAATLSFAKPATITMRDGSTLDGDVTEANGMVVLRSRQGIEMHIYPDMVRKIEYREEPELEFNQRLHNLGSDDAEGRVKLARFCLENRRPDLAREVLIQALNIDPNSREASALYDAARAQLTLEQKSRPSATPTPPPLPAANMSTTEVEAGQEGGGMRMPKPVLDADQINFIKQGEIRDSDSGLTFKFENDIEKRYAAITGRTFNAVHQLKPYERFRMMQADRQVGLGLIKDIRIARDPGAMNEYRTQVQRIVLTGCATANCHSGNALVPAGTFWLHSPAENEATTYTNFFILATRQFPVIMSNGTKTSRTLINRDIPDLSLLLQYGLSADVSRFPHPVVPGFKAPFKSTDDPRFKVVQNWIESTLTPLTPDYSFIKVQGMSPPPPTTAPATAPAATAPAGGKK